MNLKWKRKKHQIPIFQILCKLIFNSIREKIGIKEKLNVEFSFNSLNEKYIDDLCKTICKSDLEKEYEIFYTIEISGNNVNRKCSKEEKKNRYSDIIPYEYNRVLTSNGYINASWINVCNIL